MKNKNFRVPDILIGIFNYLPIEKEHYSSTDKDFHGFFFENRDKYFVLNKIVLDNSGIYPYSKDISLAEEGLYHTGLLKYNTAELSKTFLNQKAIKEVFEKFTKNKFNEKELGELEELSLEFQKSFFN